MPQRKMMARELERTGNALLLCAEWMKRHCGKSVVTSTRRVAEDTGRWVVDLRNRDMTFGEVVTTNFKQEDS